MGYAVSLADAKNLGSPIYRNIGTTKYVEMVANHITSNSLYDRFIAGEKVSNECRHMYGLYLGMAGVLVLDMLISSDKSEAQLKLFFQRLAYNGEYGKYLTYKHGDTVTITIPYKALFDAEQLEILVYKAFIKEIKHRKLQWWRIFETCIGSAQDLVVNNRVVGIRLTLEETVTNNGGTFFLDMSVPNDLDKLKPVLSDKIIYLTQIGDKYLSEYEVISGKEIYDISDDNDILKIFAEINLDDNQSEPIYYIVE